MAAEKNQLADSIGARELGTTRYVAAKPAELFAAFSDANRLAQWWGPKDFTSTFHEFDLRPGGRWRLVLHGPDGTDYQNEKEFIEVTPPGRVVLRNVSEVHGFVMTIGFASQGAGTLVTWRLQFDSADECAKVRPIVVEANEQNLDRLEAHVSSGSCLP